MKRFRKVRQDEALERQSLRDGLTDKEQLAVLDSRLGKNFGAKRERKRLSLDNDT